MEAELSPTMRAQARRDLELAYELSGQPQAARVVAQLGLEESARALEDGDPDVMLWHARLLLERHSAELRDATEARSWIERALAHRPRDESGLRLLSAVCYELGEPEEARAALQRLIAVRGDAVDRGVQGVNDYLWSLVASEFDELRPRELLADLAARLEQEPGDLSKPNALGVARYRLGEFEAAIETLEETDRRNVAMGLVSNPAFDRFVLAMCYHAEGHKQRARELLEGTVPFLDGPELGYEDLMELRSLQREAERLIAPGGE